MVILLVTPNLLMPTEPPLLHTLEGRQRSIATCLLVELTEQREVGNSLLASIDGRSLAVG